MFKNYNPIVEGFPAGELIILLIYTKSLLASPHQQDFQLKYSEVSNYLLATELGTSDREIQELESSATASGSTLIFYSPHHIGSRDT